MESQTTSFFPSVVLVAVVIMVLVIRNLLSKKTAVTDK
jgi:hypothetical protein